MKEKLDETIKKHDLINRTFSGFWKNYDQYLQDDPEECEKAGFYERNSVRPELYGYGFFITNELDFDCIKVYIDIFRNNEDFERLGDYWCIYDLDGELFDDYFVID